MPRSRARPRPRPGRKSTAKGVKRLPSSKFAYPKTREYPINTAKRARAALSYAGRKTTSGSRATVLRRIKRSSNASVRAVGKRASRRR
jgi:Family of unknown function (DUF6582)